MDMEQITQEYPHFFSPDAMAIPWIHSPFFEHLLEKTELSPDDKAKVRSFAENGYLVFDPGITEEVLEQTKAEMEPHYPRRKDGSQDRYQDGWRVSPGAKVIATAPKVLETLQMLYRREPIPFQTLNFKVGTQQRTHSDTIHFQTHPQNWMCGVWVALEDVDADNGPLHYYPRSHSLPLYDPDHIDLTADFKDYPSYEDFVEAMFSDGKFEKQEVTLKKGQAIIWAANLFHGGSPIRDPSRTRQSQVTHYYFKGCMYYTPMGSEVFLGKIHFRTEELRDLRTGEVIAHAYKGRPFQPVRHKYTPIIPARYPNAPTDPVHVLNPEDPVPMIMSSDAAYTETQNAKPPSDRRLKRLLRRITPPIIWEMRDRAMGR